MVGFPLRVIKPVWDADLQMGASAKSIECISPAPKHGALSDYSKIPFVYVYNHGVSMEREIQPAYTFANDRRLAGNTVQVN